MRKRKEEKDKSARVAAFFDLDGTLISLPSLEQRFLRKLRDHREIPLTNYFSWLSEAVRLLTHGISQVVNANKMYLRGVCSLEEDGTADCKDCAGYTGGQHCEGQASTPPRRNPRWPVARFFIEGVEQLAWHAWQGHVLVIVSGTLEPLANAAARALEAQLAARGIAANIGVCATKLEESDGKWTGRTLGEAMFGKAKARAVRRLALAMKLDMSQCWAYGDGAQDRWMLASVGHPAAVNPTLRLARIARTRGWPVLRWKEEKDSAQTTQRKARKSAHIALLTSASEGERIGTCFSSSTTSNPCVRSLG